MEIIRTQNININSSAAVGGDIPKEVEKSVFFSTSEKIINLGRANSLWPFMFGIACCSIEMMGMVMPRFDIARLGYEVFRASPRHADVMLVAGPVCNKFIPIIKKLHDQMAEPRWVIAVGSCASSGGLFSDSYYVVPGVDTIIPVDVYVPGCPPRPEAWIDGFLTLKDKIIQSKELGKWRTEPYKR